MLERYLGNNIELAERVARQTFNEAASFRIINEGQENLVIVIDESMVMRFPKSEEVWERGITERRVLERLSNRPNMPVPKIMRVSESPAFIVASYLHGHQIVSKELRSLPSATLETIGKNIATFAYNFHKDLALEEFKPLIKPPSWSYDEYLKHVLFERTDENPQIDALAKENYQKWLEKKVKSQEVVVHDDLHLGNLLF